MASSDDVTSGHVTSGSTTSHHIRKYGFGCPYILLVVFRENLLKISTTVDGSFYRFSPGSQHLRTLSL
jgi:hypothetical protein